MRAHNRSIQSLLAFAAAFLFLHISQFAEAKPRTPAKDDPGACNHPLNNPDAAISSCTRFLNGDPNGPQSAGWYNNRGIGWLKKGDTAQAVADFTAALNRDPDFFDALKNRGIAYHMGENYDSAIADFNRALSLDSSGERAAPAYNMRGASLSRKGEFERAIEDFGHAIKLDGRFVQAYVNRGDAYAALRQFLRAIADFDEAIGLDPGYLLTYIHRGDARGQLADFSGAISDFGEAIRRAPANPDSWEAYAHRGEAWRLQGDLAKSMADLNKALQLNPNVKEVYINRALTWADQGNLAKAIADCTEALVRDSRYAMAYADRGRFRRLNNDLKGSLADLDEAVKLDPSSPVALTFRGETLVEWNDIKGALEDFDKALIILPGFVAAYTGRGMAYEKNGEAAKAKEDYQKALSLSPDLDAGLARPAQKLAKERLAAIAKEEERLAALAKEKTRLKPPVESALPAAIPPDIQQALYQKGHALLIGVSDYTRGWDPLPSVKEDLRRLAEALRPSFENVETLLNPTVEQILRKLHEFFLVRWNKPDERLFVYYSGHGFTDHNRYSQKNDGYITGSDTPIYKVDDGTAIAAAVPFDEIVSWSSLSHARQVLMVFDSCFSGSLFSTKSAPPAAPEYEFDSVRRLLSYPIRYVITAGRQSQEVAADGVFATALLDGLRGEADFSHKGLVSAAQLGVYLGSEVPRLTRRTQTPQFDRIESYQEEGQFFFLTSAAAPEITGTIRGRR